MNRCDVGDKIVLDGKTATVISKVASASGMQGIHWDHVSDPFWGLEWRPWQVLAKSPKVTVESPKVTEQRTTAPTGEQEAL